MFAFNTPTSANIAELLAKKAELEASLKKNEEDLNADRPVFINQVHQLIKAFGITKEEAFPPKEKAVSVDKDYNPDYFFRDPKTGEEWDGKGKRPAYLSGKKKTNEFRIYHATGTRFAPVVKSASRQNESESAGNSPVAVVTTSPVATAAMPSVQALETVPAAYHQSVMTAVGVPVAAAPVANAPQIYASAGAAAIHS